jgi:hypothetical protein
MADNSESPATKGGRKTISRNSVLPICALLISAVACAASLYQLRMAMSSISAQTWPYVTIGWRHTNDETGIVVDNDGLGPAIIRDVVLTVDGQDQHDAISALRQIISIADASIELDALTRGVVIRAGKSLNLFVVRGASWANQLRSAQNRVNLEICYCSILGQCWSNSLASVVPREVSVCAESNRNSLELPTTSVSDSPRR